jgi:hypothetical protein
MPKKANKRLDKLLRNVRCETSLEPNTPSAFEHFEIVSIELQG